MIGSASGVVPPAARRPPPGPVDDALSLLVHAAAPLNPRQIRALRLRTGLAGGRPVSVAQVAQEMGYSRTRVRHLERRARAVAVGAGAPDSLRRALRVLGREILSVDAAAARLHDGGLTSGVLHPATVLLAAEWFGVDPSAALLELAPGHELVVPLGREAGLRQVTLLIQRRGIASIEDLAADLHLPRASLRRLIDADPRLRRHGGHAWASPDTGRNFIRHGTRRMLAVGPQTIDDLHDGLAAMLTKVTARKLPTPGLLRAYLESQPDYEVAGDLVGAGHVHATELTGTDKVLLAAVGAAAAGECSTAELRAALSAAGYSAGGAGGRATIRSAPVLRRVGLARYALRLHQQPEAASPRRKAPTDRRSGRPGRAPQSRRERPSATTSPANRGGTDAAATAGA